MVKVARIKKQSYHRSTIKTKRRFKDVIHTSIQHQSLSKVPNIIVKNSSGQMSSSKRTIQLSHTSLQMMEDKTICESISSKISSPEVKTDAWLEKKGIVNDYHRNVKKNKKTIYSQRCVCILIMIAILLITGIIAILIVFLRKSTSLSVKPINAVLRWNSSGSIVIGTVGVSGISSNQTNTPYGLTWSPSNTLYVADYGNNRIQKIVMNSLISVTIAGQINGTGGNGSNELFQPTHMAFDSNNNMYVTDRYNSRVQFFAENSFTGITIGGVTGSRGSSYNQFNQPSGIVYDSKTKALYIADPFNHRIMKYESGATSGTVVAGGNGSGLGISQLQRPFSVYFDAPTNSLIISNYDGHNVVRWVLGASHWTLITGSTTATPGNNSASLNCPIGITLDPMGNIYVADTNNRRVQFFPVDQSNAITIVGTTGVSGTTANLLVGPYWIALDNQLNLYVSDTFSHRVLKFSRY